MSLSADQTAKRDAITLAPCPGTPNCVSSLSPDQQHRIEPLRYEGEASAAMQRLISIIRDMKRSKIVAHDEYTLHAEFTSALFRFVDDVNVALDTEHKIIHMRSASRLGRSDFGVNRKRVELIRAAFTRHSSP